MKEKNEIVLFEDEGVKLEVNLQDDTVWLTQEQMIILFGRDQSVISRHINNVFKEEELDEESNMQKMHIANSDKPVSLYSLDVIISVGYRVKSIKGIKFRKWATKVLKEYMLKGYAVNQRRLEYLEKAIKLIDIATRLDEDMRDFESYNMLKLISEYTKALETLDKYDHHDIKKPKGNINKNKRVSYEECKVVIEQMPFSKNSDIFGIERDQGLESVINNIYQTFDSKEIYPSVEEKACNLLYLIVKDHIFVDGNKRIGATLFLYFLNFHNLLIKNNKNTIDPSTLVAITLFVAQSNPREKDVIIDLLMNILLDL